MIFVTLKKSSSLVHETIIVSINFIKLTKINTNIASVQKREALFTIDISYNYFLQLGLILKECEEGANHTQLRVRFET